MTKTHLLACVHGLGGSPQDFTCLSQSISNYFNSQTNATSHLTHILGEEVNLSVLLLQSNQKKLTHCGLEVMGRKMANEIEEWILTHRALGALEKAGQHHRNQENSDTDPNISYPNNDSQKNIPNTSKPEDKIILSILCHSLGGLVARAAIKDMFFGEKSEFFRSSVECGSFTTMCTPHLGTRHPGGGNHVKMIGKSLFRTGARWACKNLMGKTGMELYLKDASKLEDTMLYKMTLPGSDYMKALKLFQFHTLIASTRHDHIVPFCSASIRSHNPHRKPPKSKPSKCSVASYSGFGKNESEFERVLKFLGHDDSVNESIKLLMAKGTRHNPFTGKKQSSGWYRDNLRHSKFDSQMLTNLQTIPWRRISLEFQLPSFLNHTNAHSLCLGSWFTGSREDMTPAGIEAVRLIMMLTYMDHRALVSKFFGFHGLMDTNLDPLRPDTPCSDEDVMEKRRVQRNTIRIRSMDEMVPMPRDAAVDSEGALLLRSPSSSSDEGGSFCSEELDEDESNMYHRNRHSLPSSPLPGSHLKRHHTASGTILRHREKSIKNLDVPSPLSQAEIALEVDCASMCSQNSL